MIKLRIASNGHFMLAGASKFMLAASDGNAVLATTLSLVDYQSSYSNVNGQAGADPQPVMQRKAGTTVGDVPVMYTFTGSAPSMPQARVMQGATVIKDWTTLVSPSVQGSTGLGTLTNVPQGCDYTMQIRDGGQPGNAATISNGAQPWGVGVNVLYFGQSNMISTLTCRSYSSIVPGTSEQEIMYHGKGMARGTVFGAAGWMQSLGGYGIWSNGSGVDGAAGGIFIFLRLVAKGLRTRYGIDIPVGLLPWAFNSQGIDGFYPNSGARWQQIFNANGTTPPNIGGSSPKNYFPIGDFEGVMYHQGEANQADTSDAYRDKLVSLYSQIAAYVAQFGRTPADLFFGPAMLGNYRPDQCPSIENIRIAASKFETVAIANGWPKARIGWSCIDCAIGPDGLHMVDTESDSPATNTRNRAKTKSMRRSIQTVLYHLGCATFSGRGPSINPTVSRAGLVVTLSVVHDGGTALQLAIPGNPLKGFYANTAADFTGTDIAVTAELVNGNSQIAVTLPGGTTFPVYLKYMGGRIGSAAVDAEGYTASCSPNITNPIYDNVTYPTGGTGTDIEPLGLPLLPTFTALTVN